MNDNKNELEQSLKGIDFDDAPDNAHRDLLEEKLLLNFTAPRCRPNIKWRTIMQNKVTKFAAAAVIILGVFLGMHMLGISPDGSSVAWASLAKRIEQVKTAVYRMRSTTGGIPGDNSAKSVMEMKISSEYGFRIDSFTNDQLQTQAYMLIADKTLVTLMPQTKHFMKITLTDELRNQMTKQSCDPREMVAGFMKNDYIELGRKEIDGVTVEGIEVEDSVFMGMPIENLKAKLWVDVNTDLPVLIEMAMEMKQGDNLITSKMVLDNFQWNVELDKSEFAYVIPADYESMGEATMPDWNAKSAIEGLEMIAGGIDGKYPKSLSLGECATEFTGVINEKQKQARQLKQKAAKAAKDAGLDPETAPEVLKAKAILKKLEFGLEDQLKMQALCMFYMQLVQEKKDPAYYGDRVTPADKDMILMRWINDTDGYTVILGDLSMADFTPEEVAELEAVLPEPPQPTDPPESPAVPVVPTVEPLPVL